MLALDGSRSPYLPTREILAALKGPFGSECDAAGLARMLRERLALLHGVEAGRIALFPDDANRFERLLEVGGAGQVSLFPPADLDRRLLGRGVEILEIERSERFRIETAQIEALRPDSIALVMTPNGPTGNAIALTTAAQLARRSRLLILDERSAEMQRRSMIPLVEEFDSIVLVRSFADWAGLALDAPAYAFTTNRIAAAIDRSAALSPSGLHGALAAVSGAQTLDAIAQRVRLERLRLYRMLRKLNFLKPYPSDAGYVLAEVTRGDRDEIAEALAAREIAVFSPRLPRLERTLRFSAISPAATRQLQAALVDISRTVID
ncbi:MAG TPA: aminotransferase class I/II-fold pyridoxal phosphate-dependent enzyme [Thermomicrobiales bacterium]|nr:aminotransferase class I/II-fold pyridoxal phosphate-dependent enzyme [Thermomicrobiales bacterium]